MLGPRPISTKSSSLSLPGGSCNPWLPRSLPSSQLQSRQGSMARSEPLRARPEAPTETGRKLTQARKQASKRKSNTTNTPRPPPPVIPLPDPSEPPPAHFLRNQQALLGHAGLIAGVKPSELITLGGVSRGASPSNPIVLDDNDTEMPCEPSVLMGRSSIEYFKNLDPSQLPTPTIQEVVDMLIKLKDIFPVLQSILKLLASGGSTSRQGQASSAAATGARGWTSQSGQRQVSAQPPVKRRKLNRVPAGAADWDVPYPFLDGEGPKAYKQNWTKDRSRQLVSQLIGLVRVALEKAAAKKHVEELVERERSERKQTRGHWVLTDQQVGGRGANHYRNESKDATASSIPRNVVEVPSGLSTAAPDPPAFPITKPELGSTPTATMTGLDITTFNDLLSTLLSASDPPRSTSSQIPAPSEPLDTSQSTNNFLAAFDLSSSTNGIVDQSLVDSWMNILQTFSLPANAPTTCGAVSSDGNSLESLFGMNTPPDFSTFASPVSGDASSFSTTPNPEVQQPLDFPALDPNQVGSLDLALDLITYGASSATTGQTQVPTGINFDLSTPSGDPEYGDTQPTPASDTPMDVDKPVQLSTSPEPQSILASTQPLPMDINALLDPRLLAISFPNTSQTGASGIQLIPSTSNADSQMPSDSLPSPASTLEPVTPTSADWNMCLPGVVGGEQFCAQDSGGRPPTSEVGAEVVSTDDPASISHNEGPQKPKSRAAPFSPPALPSSSTSVAPIPPSTGVFSVVRVEDWQPQKPKRKLKKADVLEKAEEKREKIKTSLEQTKVKLWETTIEHGALLQLMRIIGEEENVIPPSLSGS